MEYITITMESWDLDKYLAYSELCQTSKVELFLKIAVAKDSIFDK